jgi:hypothetical protein
MHQAIPDHRNLAWLAAQATRDSTHGDGVDHAAQLCDDDP